MRGYVAIGFCGFLAFRLSIQILEVIILRFACASAGNKACSVLVVSRPASFNRPIRSPGSPYA